MTDLATLDRLEAALLADGPDLDTDTTARAEWHIRDNDEAAWASRRLRQAHAELAAIDAWEQREVERVKRAAQKERERAQPSVDFFTGHLAVYLQKLVNEGRRTKTLDLPGGRIAIRARQPALTVDNEAMVEWARQVHPELVVTSYKVPLPAFKKAVDLVEDGMVADPTTGEVLPFARWAEQSDSAHFTPAEGADDVDALA